MTKDEKILNRLREHLAVVNDTYDNDWFVICLQGSQNYGIDDEESDIDSKCLVLPTFHQLVFNEKPISHTLIMDNDEHCDVKDVREYFKIVRKSNINFVEIFFTPWYIVNPKYEDLWDYLISKNEIIARINEYAAVSAMKGMAHEKFHALEHEYPSRMYIIEKFGYDPKQLSHMLRIGHFIKNYTKYAPYKDCIRPTNEETRTLLYNVKRNGMGTIEEVREHANNVLRYIDTISDGFRNARENKNDPIAEKILDFILQTLMVRSIREELA